MWMKQKKGWELGNFVMMTPAIRYLYTTTQTPVSVFFESGHVKQLYASSKMITVLKRHPKSAPIISSVAPKRIRENKESDYDAYFRLVGGKGQIPDPFVPVKRIKKREGKKRIVLAHGCLGVKKIEKKSIGRGPFNYAIKRILARGYEPVLVGSKSDRRLWEGVNRKRCMDYIGKCSLLKTAEIIASCDAFITNDTGLYHVSAALGLPGLVCWKATAFDKNKCPSELVSHTRARGENAAAKWKEAIEEFLERMDSSWR